MLIEESQDGLKEKLDKYILQHLDQENKITNNGNNFSPKNRSEVIKIYKERLMHEIKIICKMKYASYFLIVSDYIKWAKKKRYTRRSR